MQGGQGQGHRYLTVAVRQGSFTDRSPTQAPAVNLGVSGLVVAQHLYRRKIAQIGSWHALLLPPSP